MIVKELKVLPSNPDFKNLTNSQIFWLNTNLQIDMDMENEAIKKATGKDEFEYTSSDMTPEELLEQVKARRQSK